MPAYESALQAVQMGIFSGSKKAGERGDDQSGKTSGSKGATEGLAVVPDGLGTKGAVVARGVIQPPVLDPAVKAAEDVLARSDKALAAREAENERILRCYSRIYYHKPACVCFLAA